LSDGTVTSAGFSAEAIFVTSSLTLATALAAVISIFLRLTSCRVAVVTSAFAPAAMLAISNVFLTFGNGVGVGVALPAAPPPPPPPAPVVGAVVGVAVAAATVTLVLEDSVPPGVPETDNVSTHVADEEGAVTDQLCEDEEEPAIVPIDLLAPETVQPPEVLDSVAVTAVVPPAVSVPAFCIVADTVNVALVETDDDDGLSETMLRSAAEFTVTCVQSAVHVVPILTQTSCEPAVLGVIVKSSDLDSPELMLDITCEVVSPVNQLPSNVAVTLDWD
jgi:hypothetical protein